jgi:hypothetical protein
VFFDQGFRDGKAQARHPTGRRRVQLLESLEKPVHFVGRNPLP